MKRFATWQFVFALSILIATAAPKHKPPQFEVEPLRDPARGDARLSPSAINNRGDVVGRSDGTNGLRAFILRKGALFELPISDLEYSAFASDINESGGIVGRGSVAGREHAFLVQKRTRVTDLHAQTSLELDAIGINNRGLLLAK